ncbi:MAG: hypothetical protein AB1646_18950 [Thermodesulfobacteriota bacterium]
MSTNTPAVEPSLSIRARELLDKGELAPAVELYCQMFDPDSQDEHEARNLLVEAWAYLAAKQILDALDCFEETMMIGTEVQRRQALEGITQIAELKVRIQPLVQKVKKILKKHLGKEINDQIGLAFFAEEENLVLISGEAASELPGQLLRGNRIRTITQRLKDAPLPIRTNRCIPFTDESDVQYIDEVASTLARLHKQQNNH